MDAWERRNEGLFHHGLELGRFNAQRFGSRSVLSVVGGKDFAGVEFQELFQPGLFLFDFLERDLDLLFGFRDFQVVEELDPVPFASRCRLGNGARQIYVAIRLTR